MAAERFLMQQSYVMKVENLDQHLNVVEIVPRLTALQTLLKFFMDDMVALTLRSSRSQ